MKRSHLSAETCLAIGSSALLWLIVATAGLAMALDHPTAINAVVGCSAPGVFTTWWAVVLVRQDQRWRR